MKVEFTPPDSLEDCVRRFFEILDSEEESDSGRLFHPTRLSSCRNMHIEELNQLFTKMKDFVKNKDNS